MVGKASPNCITDEQQGYCPNSEVGANLGGARVVRRGNFQASSVGMRSWLRGSKDARQPKTLWSVVPSHHGSHLTEKVQRLASSQSKEQELVWQRHWPLDTTISNQNLTRSPLCIFRSVSLLPSVHVCSCILHTTTSQPSASTEQCSIVSPIRQRFTSQCPER